MTKPSLTFDQLRQILVELGFEEWKIPKRFVGFHHEATDTDLVMPIHRPNQIVGERYLIMCRVQLDGRGILDADEFDRRVAAAALKHSAS